MPSSDGLRIIAGICLLIIKGTVVLGQAAAGPAAGPNAVVLINGQTVLDCVTVDMTFTQWIRTTDGSSNRIVIASGCSVNGSNSAYYRTQQPGGNICRLIIGNATVQQAGVYVCNDGSITTYWSLVTVIDPVANVVVYKQSPGVVEGDQLNISCSINYTGPSPPAPSLRPSPYFTTFPGQSFTSLTYFPSQNVVTVVARVQVQKPTVPIFRCNTVFEITGNTGSYNATTPADNVTLGATTELDVHYNASTPNIISSSVNCSTIVLTCNSSGHPAPNYSWFLWNTNFSHVKILDGQNLTISEVNQSYTCDAYNTIRNYTHNASANETISESNYTSNCNEFSPGTTDLLATILPAAILGGYGLCNIIATIVFMVYYNHRANKMNNENEMSPFKNKATLNARFPWLQRMLPCMNESRGNAGCTFMWVVLFILMSILTGIIVFPILIGIVNCSRKRKNSKVSENSDIGMRNVDIDDDCQEYTRASATPSTAAHGDTENPYETVGTVRFHPVKTSEDPITAKSNNATEPRKVLYTKVNPNFSSGEEVERYGVSPPGESPES